MYCLFSDGADETRDVVEGASTCLSSRSFNSMHSLYATGPDPYDKLKYKPGKAIFARYFKTFPRYEVYWFIMSLHVSLTDN